MPSVDDRGRRRPSLQDYPPIGPVVQVAGHPVHAVVDGQGSDLILLHGASGNAREFTFDLMPRLVSEYRVTAFDRPGLGHTPPLHADGETPAEQAALLNAASAKLGITRALVLGHSYGAAVAMAWALNHPERVAGVLSLAGATMPWKGPLGPWYRIASSKIGGALAVPFAAHVIGPMVQDGAVRTVFAPQPVPKGYARHIGTPLILRTPNLRANARQVNGLKPHVTHMSSVYHQLDIPVEILHGDRDTIVPLNTHSYPMSARLPNAALTVLPGIGHMPHHADPEATVAAIQRLAARAGLRDT